MKASAVSRSLGLAASSLYGDDDFNRLAADQALKVVCVITPNAVHKGPGHPGGARQARALREADGDIVR